MHTIKYCIKDSVSGKRLDRLAGKTNQIWNFCNNLDRKAIEKYQEDLKNNSDKEIKIICKSYTNFDLNKLLVGYCKSTGLNAESIQEIARHFADAKSAAISKSISRKKFGNKSFLPIIKFRSNLNSLGWIPMRAKSFQLKERKAAPASKKHPEIIAQSIIRYQKYDYKYWNSNPLPDDSIIKTGSFTRDSCGKWFINIVFESKSLDQAKLAKVNNRQTKVIGIDLGVKNLATLSEEDKKFGQSIGKADMTKKYEDKLAKAQRAKKKRQVSKIQKKIKNCRKDYLHKISTYLVQNYSDIAVGNVKSQDIIDLKLSKNMTKGVYDAGWHIFKTQLKYKSIQYDCLYEEINEEYTTVECCICQSRSGPTGSAGLSIRKWKWKCVSCHAEHDRDINSAMNIKDRYLRKNYYCR